MPGAANNADAATAKSDPSLTQSKKEERDLNMKWDKAFINKFANPSTFFEQLFNVAGLNTAATEVMIEMLAERI
jgi:hypothetical protein